MKTSLGEMKASPDDYMVSRQGPLIVVWGENPPSSDLQSLLRGWDYAGYKWCATRAAGRLGACLVVCKSIDEEEEWLRQQAEESGDPAEDGVGELYEDD